MKQKCENNSNKTNMDQGPTLEPEVKFTTVQDVQHSLYCYQLW